MVFERTEGEVINFNITYRMRMTAVARCIIMLGREKLEEVSEFKCLGTVLCKHGSVEGEIRQRVIKGRSVMESLAEVMKGRNVSLGVKRGLRNSIRLPPLTYGPGNWTWSRA